MEVWKDIDTVYEVSNYGNVRSKERITFQPYKEELRVKHLKSRVLTQQPSLDGYLRVKLYNRYVSVSHLVATAFVENPNGYTVVHHKNHNNQDNRAENLEWVDVNYHNAIHMNEKTKQVYQYTIDGTLVKIWSSSNECGRNGFIQSKVSLCCNGIRKQHKGFRWSYEPLA